MTDAWDGVLVIDKPEGPTSHDVVDLVRRALGVRKAGHTGTLDPFASGVLPLCLGRATRLARFLAAGEKEYEATVRFGVATTTDDRNGEPLGPSKDVVLERDAIAGAVSRLVGDLMQIPPAFSAKHVGGRRLYEWARAGIETARTAVPVRVEAIDVLSLRASEVDVRVRCGPGTYIRAIARDMGEALGVGGHLVRLRRVRSGAFGLVRAVAPDALEGAAESLWPLASLLPEMPGIEVNAAGAAAVRHGRLVTGEMLASDPSAFSSAPRVRIVDGGGRLLALAVPRGHDLPSDAPPLAPALHPDIVLTD